MCAAELNNEGRAQYLLLSLVAINRMETDVGINLLPRHSVLGAVESGGAFSMTSHFELIFSRIRDCKVPASLSSLIGCLWC
jgi:hypothetical protein